MCEKEVDFFEHPRYNINKFLLSCNGQWPYQKKNQTKCLVGLTLTYSLIALPAQFNEVIVHRDDWSIMIPALGPIFVHTGFVIKMLNSIVCSDRMRYLLERIRDDWHGPMGPEEKVLAQYADDGRKLTIIYTASLYSSGVFFLILSTMPRIIVINGWANITSPTLFPIPVHYTSHDEDYYVYIQFFLCSGILLLVSVTVAVDGMFVVFVQHACGIFAMIGYQLEHMIETENLNFKLHPSYTDDKTFWIVVNCIKKHNKAIEFVILLESAYSWSFLLLLGLNMLSISCTGLQVIWGANPESLDEGIRQAVFGGTQLLHLFFESFFCQRLTDHSILIFHAINNSMWYLTSIRTRKLLNFMLLRSIIPWELRPGKICAMSMENFSAILRTSLSYLTILDSMQ